MLAFQIQEYPEEDRSVLQKWGLELQSGGFGKEHDNVGQHISRKCGRMIKSLYYQQADAVAERPNERGDGTAQKRAFRGPHLAMSTGVPKRVRSAAGDTTAGKLEAAQEATWTFQRSSSC